MVAVSPNIIEAAKRLRLKYGIVRDLSPSFFKRVLSESEMVNSCYVNFWRGEGVSYFVIYRVDRLPADEECLPWIQELFSDGQIHEVTGEYHREFFQGPSVYSVNSIADQMGDALAERADIKDEVEQFDFDKTDTGMHMIEKIEKDNV